jgi:Putative zinc-finger
MMFLSCAAVRRRLPAFYDRELPVSELIAIQTHVIDCPPCGREFRELQAIGDGLRLVAAPAPADDWTGVQPGVISRMKAERNESWTARVGRMFDDLHLVWIGMASTTATFLCAATVLSMLHFAPQERRRDSLAAVIAVMAAPYGSDVNPFRFDSRIQVPTVPDSGQVYEALENRASHEDREVAFAASVSREGRVSGLEVLGNAPDLRQMDDLLRGLTRGRLEPAQFDGAPVAANLVWLVANTTVRGKYRS